jgi:hypothetical protein
MIHVTDEPMEGVAFIVQDHTQRTGTIWTGSHGEMINSDLHGAEELTRLMPRPHPGGRDRTDTLHHKRRGRSTSGTPAQLDLGGLTHFQWDAGSRWPRKSPGGL